MTAIKPSSLKWAQLQEEMAVLKVRLMDHQLNRMVAIYTQLGGSHPKSIYAGRLNIAKRVASHWHVDVMSYDLVSVVEPKGSLPPQLTDGQMDFYIRAIAGIRRSLEGLPRDPFSATDCTRATGLEKPAVSITSLEDRRDTAQSISDMMNLLIPVVKYADDYGPLSTIYSRAKEDVRSILRDESQAEMLMNLTCGGLDGLFSTRPHLVLRYFAHGDITGPWLEFIRKPDEERVRFIDSSSPHSCS